MQELVKMFRNCYLFLLHSVNFNLSDSVYNILTMKALPQKAAHFLNAEIVGQERYKSFVAEKVNGDG